MFHLPLDYDGIMGTCLTDHVKLNDGDIKFYCPKDHVTLKIMMGTLCVIVLRIMLY